MVVNGATYELEGSQTLYDFLIAQNYNLYMIAIELNEEIIPREAFKETLLHNDDVIEIVKFVGGGC